MYAALKQQRLFPAAIGFSSFGPKRDSQPYGTPRRRTERTGVILPDDSLLETDDLEPPVPALGESRISMKCPCGNRI
ncbi:MAG: hypothetical protein DMG05_11775 [Acidobacteria bacterium]|nr:MAG: hypothetical protein DMG05_11775 [Acidobacteriota bacterium]